MKTTLPEGSTCQQPDGCQGVSILDADELRIPALCIICQKVLCDTCAAYLEHIPMSEIPASSFIGGKKPNRETCDGYTCSEHFNEDWFGPPQPTKEFCHGGCGTEHGELCTPHQFDQPVIERMQ